MCKNIMATIVIGRVVDRDGVECAGGERREEEGEREDFLGVSIR